MSTPEDIETSRPKQRRQRDRSRKAEQRATARENGFRPYTFWLGPEQKAATIKFVLEFFSVDPRSPKAVAIGSPQFDPLRFQRLLAAMRGLNQSETPTARKKPKDTNTAPDAELFLEYGPTTASITDPNEGANRNETNGKNQAAAS